jgi:hypothetical protein
MPVQYWLLIAAAAALPCARLHLRRRATLLLKGRTRSWRLHVRRDATLRARGFRLRLYGVECEGSSDGAVATLKQLLVRRPVRWRVMTIDGDGTAAILLRVEGENVASILLQRELVRVRGSGARRLRALLRQSQMRRGFGVGIRPRRAKCRTLTPLPFPWWQG